MDLEAIKQLNKKYKKEKINWSIDNLTKEWSFNIKHQNMKKSIHF